METFILYFIGALVLVDLIAASCVVYFPLIGGIAEESRTERRFKNQRCCGSVCLMSIGLIISLAFHGSFLYFAIFKDFPFMWLMLKVLLFEIIIAAIGFTIMLVVIFGRWLLKVSSSIRGAVKRLFHI